MIITLSFREISERWPNLWAISGGLLQQTEFTPDELTEIDKTEKNVSKDLPGFLTFMGMLTNKVRSKK